VAVCVKLVSVCATLVAVCVNLVSVCVNLVAVCVNLVAAQLVVRCPKFVESQGSLPISQRLANCTIPSLIRRKIHTFSHTHSLRTNFLHIDIHLRLCLLSRAFI